VAELKRTLTAWRGAALMLNIVLGAGLLTLPVLAVREAGDSAIWIWMACALASLPLLAVFALLGQRFPDAGGLPAIAGIAMGRRGYVACTFLFLGAVVFGLPAIAIVGGYYAAAIFGGQAHGFALGFLFLAVGANAVDPEIAGRVNAAIASLLVIVLIGIAAVGLSSGPETLARLSFGDPASLPPRVFGIVFMMVFFAFTGWEVGANLSGEFKNPRRDFPIALSVSFALAILLYGALALVAQSSDLEGAHEAPFTAVFSARFGTVGGIAISAVSVLLVFANLSAAIWAVSRVVFSAASEGLLPHKLSVTRDGTPVLAVLATATVLSLVVMASWAGQLDLDVILAVAGQNFLLLYGAAALSMIPLRKTLPSCSISLRCLARTLTTSSTECPWK
jgi:amino acid efflux transporter